MIIYIRRIAEISLTTTSSNTKNKCWTVTHRWTITSCEVTCNRLFLCRSQMIRKFKKSTFHKENLRRSRYSRECHLLLLHLNSYDRMGRYNLLILMHINNNWDQHIQVTNPRKQSLQPYSLLIKKKLFFPLNLNCMNAK